MIRLDDKEIKKVIQETWQLPLMAAYEAMCQRQMEKIVGLMDKGTTLDELKKEVGI